MSAAQNGIHEADTERGMLLGPPGFEAGGFRLTTANLGKQYSDQSVRYHRCQRADPGRIAADNRTGRVA